MARPTAPRGAQSLAQGLEVLRLLAEARTPLTATAIAEAIGVSVSTASRTLGALAAAGYVRKPDFHSFAVDVGVLALAGHAREHFREVAAAHPPLQALTQAVPELRAALATLHGGQLIYFLQAQRGSETVELSVGRYPLHLSSIALRLLVERPDRDLLAALRASRRRYGWDRPGPAAPADEAACLAAARTALDGGCLLLDGWQAAGHVSAAVRIPIDGHPPLGLALAGPRRHWTASAAAALADAAAAVAAALGAR